MTYGCDPVDDAAISAAQASSPTWITAIRVRETLTVFQPYYGWNLSAHDAIEILVNVTNLYRVLINSGPKGDSLPE